MSRSALTAHALSGRFGAAAGSLLYEVAPKRRRVALRNLALALPDTADRALDAIARASFRHFGRSIFESVSLGRLDSRQICRLLTFENWDEFAEAEALGNGVIILTAHLGVHEVLGPTVALYRGPMHMVARPLRRAALDRHVRAIRERFGNRTLPKKQATRGMLRALDHRERVAILIDQRVHPFQGVRVPFFNRASWTSPLPAQLSLRSGAPVLPLFAYRNPKTGYRVVVHPAIVPPDRTGAKISEDAVRELTASYAGAIESAIRREIDQWMWMHDRWRRH